MMNQESNFNIQTEEVNKSLLPEPGGLCSDMLVLITSTTEKGSHTDKVAWYLRANKTLGLRKRLRKKTIT